MPTVFKLTSIFQATTIPVDQTVATSHTGGWTESVWTNLDSFAAFNGPWSRMQRARAALLPATCKIIGYRYTQYNYTGNILSPGVSFASRQNYPGVLGNRIDLPQVALQMQGQTAGLNTDTLTLRGIPDIIMTGGEYSPSTDFATAMRAYVNAVSMGSFGFIGRDKTQPSVRVLNCSQESVRLLAIPPGLAVDDYVRLNRVLDSNGRAISGTFRVASLTVVNPGVILADWPAPRANTKASGTLRKDLIAYFPYTNLKVVRAMVKKVGSPLEKYRGRRSKRRAA